ncbi:MAG: hypothetical protein OEZ43_08965 [Gammaproteobacteria bacterium]|nr:hypothetical protein [Gammaproteobacteria bacterium]
MRIDQPRKQTNSDQPPSKRVCPHCDVVCPSCGAKSCDCQCNMDCSGIARAMVAEPDRFPIESQVLPLVYAIATNSPWQPIWSCEGHAQQDGELLRHPQVWFYAENHIRIDSVKQVLDQLGAQLKAKWRVEFSELRQNTPVYILEAYDSESVALKDMQRDIQLLAKHLDNSSKSAK